MILLKSDTVRSYVQQLRRIASARDLKPLWIFVFAAPLCLALLDAAARIAKLYQFMDTEAAYSLSVSRDHSFAEMIGYVELFGAAILIWLASSKLRDHRLKIVSAIVLYLMCDDLFLFHDRARQALGPMLFSGHGSKRIIDFGELVVFAGIITVIMTLLVLVYRKAQPIHFCRLFTVVGGFAVLAFFAAIVDETGSFLEGYGIISTRFHRTIETIEDSGELFGIGLILMASLILYRMGKEAAASQSSTD